MNVSIARAALVLALTLLTCLAEAQEPPPIPFDMEVGAAIEPLPFRIIDAEISGSLNAIIAVAESPNQLHVYDPEAKTAGTVNLQVPPRCISVSPDGLFAVVGHDAWVSWVDLTTLTLLDTIPISTVVNEIVHGGNGYAYI